MKIEIKHIGRNAYAKYFQNNMLKIESKKKQSDRKSYA